MVLFEGAVMVLVVMLVVVGAEVDATAVDAVGVSDISVDGSEVICTSVDVADVAGLVDGPEEDGAAVMSTVMLSVVS